MVPQSIPMNFLLKRIHEGPNYTCGHLYLQVLVPTQAGQEPPKSQTAGCPSGFHHEWQLFCDTLEPPYQERWRDRTTTNAIPPGSYPLVVSFSPRFQRMLPLLMNVPGRSGIRIHAGNRAHKDPVRSDTIGCILVGKSDHIGHLTESRRTLAQLLKRLAERPEGEAVRMEVTAAPKVLG